MVTPILATKLYIPPPPPKVVPRPRLVERLNEGLHRKLTLISAPAGFGKSTLVSAWAATTDRKVAWLSLDEGDSDPTRFLTYLVAALRTVAPNIGGEVLSALQSPQPPPIEPVLTALLNEITILSANIVLVLDDYHVIDNKTVDNAIIFLTEHLPPQMHLVITTREDPQLPMARLRARGQLTELRAADLRFTPTEAAGFLNQSMGLDLTIADIGALETRTEGWIAGLQLAALSLQGHPDIPAFIRTFTGDHRYIVDYLVEEVLQRQPESVRHFLLQTSILDRLNGPLCDAVTGQHESQARLAALERGNFFVVPLDDKRHWYRYHHLFADVLYAHLIAETAEQPGQVATLHQRASEWYEHNGPVADAIRHALAAEDYERAANLAEGAVPALRRGRQETILLGWLKSLPEEVIYVRPVLNGEYAGALLAVGDLDGVEPRLRDAEHWLNMSAETNDPPGLQTPSQQMVFVYKEELRRLPVSIAVWRAGLALVLGDVPRTVKYARLALDLLPDEEEHLGRGAATALLGLASWVSGDLETAHRTFAEGMARVQRAGFIPDVINSAIALADIRIAQGRLHDAMSTYEGALHLATEHGNPVMRGTAGLYVGMSELHCEHNDLHIATEYLLKSKELGEHTGFPQNRYRWCVAMSRIREAEGDLDGALELLHEAERVYVRDFFPNVRPVAALKTRIRLAQGKLDEALDWARQQGVSVEGELSYLREFEHITLVRVLLAQYKSDHTDRPLREAVDLLERLLKAAEEGGRTGSVIAILVLQSLAHHAKGDIPAALVPLQQALTLADPEGYVRIFVDEGNPMKQLLKEAVARGIMPGYTGKLLAAFEPDTPENSKSEDKALLPPAATAQPFIEPLSDRELDVLRLLRTELSGPEIADALTVSLSTVRTHTRSIYNKLGVDNRRAAIRRAEVLHLL